MRLGRGMLQCGGMPRLMSRARAGVVSWVAEIVIGADTSFSLIDHRPSTIDLPRLLSSLQASQCIVPMTFANFPDRLCYYNRAAGVSG
jgi:hypothetical protein